MKNDDFLYVIDLDRTLIDTDKVIEILFESLVSAGVDGAAFISKLEKARINEENIDTKAELDKLGTNIWNKFSEYFLSEVKKRKIVYDDSFRFLDKLAKSKSKHMILTYGLSKAWQRLKLDATQLSDINYLITDTRDKSGLIQSWKDDKGIFQVPKFSSLSAKKIILIDDREKAFLNTDKLLTGYLIDRAGKFDKKSEDLPKYTKLIKSFDELVL